MTKKLLYKQNETEAYDISHMRKQSEKGERDDKTCSLLVISQEKRQRGKSASIEREKRGKLNIFSAGQDDDLHI